MNLSDLKKADRATLKRFGLIMAVPLILIAVYFQWKGHRTAATYLFVLAGLFAFHALNFPKVLNPVYIGWMTLARFLGIITTTIILTVFFFLVIVPAGLGLRLFGRDLLSRRFPEEKESYWIDHRPCPDDLDRYSKPF